MGERARELTILILGDIACFILALYVTLFVRYLELPSAERLSQHFGPFLILSGVWVFLFFSAGLYDKHTTLLKRALRNRIVYTQIANFIVAAMLFLIIPFGIAPKTNLVIYLIVSTMLISVWRLTLFNYFSHKQRHEAILIADGEEAIELADEINNNDRYNYSFVRIIDKRAALHVQNFEEKLLHVVEQEQVKIIVADPKGEHLERILPSIFNLSFLRFELTFLNFHKVYEDTFDRVPVSSLTYDWFITHVSQSRNSVYDLTKRIIDIVGASLLLIPFGLLFPFIALAIKLEDKGPLLYRTERIGQYNRPVHIYKFRTKNGLDSSDEALHSALHDTKVGTFLRKSRLDELPQLINIVRGDLSFIGPRPEMPSIASVYAEKIPYYNSRHFIKPGLSGWAQINDFDVPRGGVDVERTIAKLSYDLFYLKRRSLLMDVHIAAKTLAILMRRTGS